MATIPALSAKDCGPSAVTTQRSGALDDLQISRIIQSSHQAFKWAGRAQGRDVLIQIPNLPRALNIWLKPRSVATCEPRRTVTLAFGVSQCAKVAAPTKSKMRISNIPAVASFLKLPEPSVKPAIVAPPPRELQRHQKVDTPRPEQRQQVSRVNAAAPPLRRQRGQLSLEIEDGDHFFLRLAMPRPLSFQHHNRARFGSYA